MKAVVQLEMMVALSLTRERMLAEMDQALADEIVVQNQHSRTHHTATNGQLLTTEKVVTKSRG